MPRRPKTPSTSPADAPPLPAVPQPDQAPPDAPMPTAAAGRRKQPASAQTAASPPTAAGRRKQPARRAARRRGRGRHMIAVSTLMFAAHLLSPEARAEREAGLAEVDLREYVGLVHHEVLGALRLAQQWLEHLRPPLDARADSASSEADHPAAWWLLLDQSLTTAATLAEYLLVLMRSGPVNALQKRPLSATELLEHLVLPMRASTTIPITTSILPPDLLLWVDPLLLAQALSAALRNAILALEESGTPQPQIMLHVMRQHGTISFLLTDNGPGFPADLLRTMTAFAADATITPQPFSTRSGGSGFGIPWLIKVAALHGGSVMLGNREDEAGAWIEVRLPAVAPA